MELIAEAVPVYAAALRLGPRGASAVPPSSGAPVHLLGAAAEATCAYWLTLDAVNFGSGWFPTLRKRDGRSGYHTVAMGTRTGSSGSVRGAATSWPGSTQARSPAFWARTPGTS